MPLKNDGTPYYRQVAADLRAQIEAGTLKPGDKLPSTQQLRDIYGVSGTVIQFAMVELKAQGLVVGQPGRGVFVAERPA
ncbi:MULTISPECIES: winged helix-turn-helix domain-containing protein [Dactylosporangium]|uniref:HTH gntR-type domain-containing protein n=1 Tax=Dactylosporangium darangshiense TaxID=579108 RepID=A0ABP8DA46_9ACTN